MPVTSVGYSPISPMPFPGEVRLQEVRQHDTQPEKKAKPQEIKSTAENIQRLSQSFNKKLRFVVDQSSNQVIVKVIDKETDKVIKELPPEELQRLYSNLKEAIGLLFDEMV